MVDKKNWEEFRNTGLVLMINQFLHIFGWALVFEFEDDKIKSVYPARVKFRGFDSASTKRAYKKISKYMVENADQLKDEIED